MKRLTENEITSENIVWILKGLLKMCQDKDIEVRTSCFLYAGDSITEVDTGSDNETIIFW